MLSKILAVIILAASFVALSATVASQPWGLRTGKLERSFGQDGLKFLDIEGFTRTVSLLQPDGQLILLLPTYGFPNSQTVIVRFLRTGELDPGFGEDGHLTLDFGARNFGVAIVRQPDGKLVIAGSTADASGQFDLMVLRLTENGKLDPAFGNNGVIIKDFAIPGSNENSSDYAISLALLPDGKLLVGGKSDRYSAPGRAITYSNLLKLGPDGSPDTTFGNGGLTQVEIGTDPNYGFFPSGGMILATQPDGKILAGLSVEQPAPKAPQGFEPHAFVVRYLANGAVDSTFADSGTLAIFPGQFCFLTDLKLLDSGKFLILFPGGLMRHNADGSVDKTFGTDGYVLISSFQLASMVITPDQRIVISSSEAVNRVPGPGFRSIGRLQRLGWNGSPDPRFGWAGVTRVEPWQSDHIEFGQVHLWNDKIIVVGKAHSHVTGELFIARFFASK